MKEYFLIMVVAAVVSGVVISLSPSGSVRQVRLLCGLCTTALITLPLVSFLSNTDFTDGEWLQMFDGEQYEEEYDEIYNEALKNVENENANYMLKSKIIQALSVDKDCFDVRLCVNAESDEKSIERVEVILYVEGISVDPHKIKKYVSDLLGCECSIYYDF